jgi:dTDP-4-amino-4,6-dideoxygalactose transaminase
MDHPVPFVRPPITGREIDNLRDAIERRELSSNGDYTKACQDWLRRRLGAEEALLTHSCTGALEMAAMLSDLAPGDEVIMPSYTFVSTANAVVLRRAVPVFIDIRRDTLNIDETLIEAAITPKTKAIFVVHYAGVPCEMKVIADIARRRKLRIVEDAAQALLSTYEGRPAGTLGDMACFSFHVTKNIVSGEGGALIVQHPELAKRAHIIWEKGTNRRAFYNGEVDKYTWVDIGSSFLPSEIVAAFLAAQLAEAEAITKDRLATWQFYHQAFEQFERRSNKIVRPSIPANVEHNGHLYYLLLRDKETRDATITSLREKGIGAPFHYVPLHSSPAGRKFGRAAGPLPVTDDVAERLIRLPLWSGIGNDAEKVVETISKILK